MSRYTLIGNFIVDTMFHKTVGYGLDRVKATNACSALNAAYMQNKKPQTTSYNILDAYLVLNKLMVKSLYESFLATGAIPHVYPPPVVNAFNYVFNNLSRNYLDETILSVS